MATAQKIAWPRIAAESAAIVASILLAFAIDAWWDDLQNRELESEYLDALAVETAAGLRELELDTDVRVKLQAALIDFLNGAAIGREDFIRLISGAARSNNIAPPTSVVEELVATGRLQLVQSAELAKTLLPASLGPRCRGSAIRLLKPPIGIVSD